ncbi:tRNA pseudouridine32 synthase/23S rRNA pseudouridine746 synthase [Rhodococcus sp. AG1013]|uniref:pseudouridine synthase n=1 Tax=Rhodococcus sp. AG1013 TaxID=2183996 RepID=UPI000E0B8541|nr:pseudouridine synthase [Rhodococcus sp. AG1013]RDI19960.1 tRNA pseudouridine32 synthase/23S rRNA pseudouridine746 synthase [Rhodococcus sp. AG1013]
MARAPLPIRDGLGPDRIRMPAGQPSVTVVDYLLGQHPGEDWDTRLGAGEVVDEHGRVVDHTTPYQPTRFVYFYREPAPEVPVPFAVDVLHRDAGLVVVDKPHFLATIPRGAHIRETVVVRLRRDLGLPDLVPVHRLDRMTAGVLLCTADPALRRPYQEMFEKQRVRKTYEAIAPALADGEFPRTVRSRIRKVHGELTASEEPGEPNSETLIELGERRGALARYRLRPRTGRTHQLRLHLNSLGAPIVGDNFYPEFRRRDPNDFTDPLRLLARSLEFDDPLTGEPRRFESRRTLEY